jgi:hypothetical protein
MLNRGVETSELAQPEVITAQHCTRMIGIAGPGAGTPDCVSLHRFQPADQIPCGSPNGRRARQRVRLCQVQPAHARGAGLRLSLDLNEIVLPGEGDGSADYGVLRGFRNGRTAALRCWRGLPRMTAGQPATNQENSPDTATTHHLGACAAPRGGEPCAWIQVHADLRDVRRVCQELHSGQNGTDPNVRSLPDRG